MENRMRVLCFLCFIFFVSVLFFSCNFLQEELQTPREYQLQAPSVPEDWLAQSGLHLQSWLWLVDYVHTDSQSHNYALKQKRHYGSSISISVKKRESAVALVYPIFAEFGAVSDPRHLLWRPAGIDILWQERSGDFGHSELRASWQAGFRSFVLDKLLEGGFDIRYFNAEKLQRYIDLRTNSGSGSDSVWDFDTEYLIAEIANLEADWYDIRKRQTTQVFGLPSEGGFWQSLDMLAPAWRCQGQSGAACSPELALGRHYFLELEKLQLWQLEVLESGEVLAVLLSGLR